VLWGPLSGTLWHTPPGCWPAYRPSRQGRREVGARIVSTAHQIRPAQQPHVTARASTWVCKQLAPTLLCATIRLSDVAGLHACTQAACCHAYGQLPCSRTLGPLVHHILVPFRMYLSPFRSARVRMLTASEPAPGSLMDRAPMCSPADTRGVQQTTVDCGVTGAGTCVHGFEVHPV
jgi:hypothetical protein